MCVIVHKPKGIKISYKIIEKCAAANPDGFGCAYIDNGKVRVNKSLTLPDKGFFKSIPDSDVVFHFRIRTRGKITLSNCHPFSIGKGYYLFHNGTIPNFGDGDMSDTAHFCAVLRAGRVGKAFINKSLPKILNAIGGSKFAIIGPDGVQTIGSFYERDGIFFSNLAWEFSHAKKGKKKKSTDYSPYFGYSQYRCKACNRVVPYSDIRFDVRKELCFKCLSRNYCDQCGKLMDHWSERYLGTCNKCLTGEE